MSDKKEESKSVRINIAAYEGILLLQKEMAAKVNFVPSITQIIEYLVFNEIKRGDRS
jgi:hypothetical protein